MSKMVQQICRSIRIWIENRRRKRAINRRLKQEAASISQIARTCRAKKEEDSDSYKETFYVLSSVFPNEEVMRSVESLKYNSVKS